MEKTRKWRKILAMMLTVVMMLQNAQSVMVFADVTNEQIEQRLAGNQEQTEETQPAQSQVDTRANGEEYKTQSQETQDNGNDGVDIGSPDAGSTTTEAKTSNADVSATITQSVFQADVSGTTCNFVQMTAQITNNDTENPATGVSIKALLNSAQLSWVNKYGTETAGAGAYAVDSNNTADLPDGSADGYNQIVMWTDQTIGAGETVAYQFAAQIIPENLDGVVNAWYVDGTSCSYTWENTEILVPTPAPVESTPEVAPPQTEPEEKPEVKPEETTPEVTEAPEVTPAPEVTEVPEATPTPEVTEVPEATPTPEVTEVPEATPTPEPTQAADDDKQAKLDEQNKLLSQSKDRLNLKKAPASNAKKNVKVQDGINGTTPENVSDDVVYAEADKLGEFITSVTMYTSDGKPYNPSSTVASNGKASFRLTISENDSINSEDGKVHQLKAGRTYTYELPTDLIKNIREENGSIYDTETGESWGTYRIYTTSNGRIGLDVTFNDNIGADAESGKPWNTATTVTFTAQFRSDQIKTGETERIEFGDKATVDVKFSDAQTVTAVKSAGEYVTSIGENGGFRFTIDMDVDSDISKPITVTDTLGSNLKLPKDPKFEIKKGDTVVDPSKYTIDSTKNPFVITFGEGLEKGEYSISYDAEIKEIDKVNGKIAGLNNNADIEYNGKKVSAPFEVDFSYDWIRKNGTQVPGTREVKWELNVNNSALRDISGKEITDQLITPDNVYYDTTKPLKIYRIENGLKINYVTVDDWTTILKEDGKSWAYTMGADAGTYAYVFEYSTIATQDGTYFNTARIGKVPALGEVNVSSGTGDGSGVGKRFVEITSDKKYAKWESTITIGTKGSPSKDVIYTDTLLGNHNFADPLSLQYGTPDESVTGYASKVYYTGVDRNDNFKLDRNSDQKFTINFGKFEPANQVRTITVTYYTLIDGSGKLQNSATGLINDKTYGAVASKVVSNRGLEKHGRYNGDGTITWQIDIENGTGSWTEFTDTYDAQYQTIDTNSIQLYEGQTKPLNSNLYIKDIWNNGNGQFGFKVWLENPGFSYRIVYNSRLKNIDNSQWNDSLLIKNKVTATGIGSSNEAEVTIPSNVFDKKVTQEATEGTDKKFIAKYELDINPNKLDLSGGNSGQNDYHISDVMTGRSEVKTDTIKIIDQDTGNQIPIKDGTGYQAGKPCYTFRMNDNNVLEIIIYNGNPHYYKLTYDAEIKPAQPGVTENVDYSNTATFSIANVKIIDIVENHVEIEQDSSASSSASYVGIKVKKVDNFNYGLTLPGATFAICEGAFNNYEEAASKTVIERTTTVNGKTGSLDIGEGYFGQLSRTEENGTLRAGQTYTIYEIAAPNGYKLDKKTYIITFPKTDGTVVTVPTGSTLKEFGSTVTVADQKVTSLYVEKVWENDNNNEDGNRASITVALKKTVNGITSTVENSSEELSNDNSWKYTWNELPTQESVNGNTYPVSYSVEEINVPSGYSVSYSNVTYDESKNRYECTVTNTYTKQVKEVSVKKVWNDENNQDGNRPNEIQVTLQRTYTDAQGNEVRNEDVPVAILAKDKTNPVTLKGSRSNTEGSWEPYSWGKLPARINGKDITYSVKETIKYADNTPDNQKYTSNVTSTDKNGKVEIVLTNSIGTEKVNVTVSKKWQNDNNNEDGNRPTSITYVLYKKVNNSVEEINEKKVEVKKDGSWPDATWENLPKKSAGQVITYLVKEKNVQFYEPSLSENEDGSGNFKYTMTNTYHRPETSVKVNKVWEDDNNRDGKRPAKITVTVKEVSGNSTQDVTFVQSGNESSVDLPKAGVGDDDKWSHTWENLLKYRNGKEIEYTVEETAENNGLNSYEEPTVSKTKPKKSENVWNLLLTNTKKIEKVKVTVTKTWNDNNDQDGVRSNIKSITFILKANGENEKTYSMDSTAISSVNDWTQWTYEWSDLPKYENGGTKINYTVDESVEYKTGQNIDSRKYNEPVISKISEDTDGNLVFNVTNTYTPETMSVKATKTWDDNDNTDGLRDNIDKIILTLQKRVAQGDVYSGDFTSEGIAEATYEVPKDKYVDSDNWNTWDNLPKYANGKLIQYRVKEDITYKTGETRSYTQKYNGNDSLDASYVTGENKTNNQAAVAIQNVYGSEKITINVNKIWNDREDRDGLRKHIKSIEFKLQGRNKGTENWTTLTGKTQERDLSGDNPNYDIQVTWDNLSKYEGGVLREYRVVETVTYKDGTKDDEKYESPKYRNNLICGASGTVEIINTHIPEKVKVKVKKTWDDANNQDNYRPSELNVTLYKVVESGNGSTQDVEVTEFPTAGESANRTLTGVGVNKWSDEWTELYKYENGKEIQYKVLENSFDKKDKYTEKLESSEAIENGTKVYSFTFTNTHTTDTTKLAVIKNWDDGNDIDGIRPKEIKLELLADGTKIQDITLSASKDPTRNWKWTSDDLPVNTKRTDKNTDYHRIVYTVKETTAFAEGTYKVSYMYQSELGTEVKPNENSWDTCILTNTHETGTTNVLLLKYWYDNENKDRPEEAKFELTKQIWNTETGKYDDPVTVDGSTKTVKGSAALHLWQTTWEGLPKKENGKDIIYAVKELDVPKGYTAIITGEKNVYTATNILSTIKIHKRAIAGLQELEGAHMELYVRDKETNTLEKIAEWVSGGEAKVITSKDNSKLVPGAVCVLKETAAPDGYTLAQDVEFTINSDGKVQEVYMYDGATKVNVSKKTITGESEEGLEGAELQILDKNGKPVSVDGQDYWTSDGTTKTISNLPVGNYILHEKKAPDGYYTADDISFEITADGEVKVKTGETEEKVTELTMIDYPVTVSISKKDVTGKNELKGATLGLYRVESVTNPETGETTENLVQVGETWESGNTPKEIKNLIIGETYVLKELKAPNGYSYAADIRFVVKNDKEAEVVDHVQNIEMLDGKHNIQIAKVVKGSDNSYVNVPGAEMQIKKGDDIIEEWTSENKPHIVEDKDNKIVSGETYILHEKKAPAGYLLASDIVFTVGNDGKVSVVNDESQTNTSLINMIDEPQTVTVLKTKEDGVTPLAGAKLQIVDSSKDKNDEGYVVETWTSGETAHTVEAKLSADKTYYLEEVNAPAGYTIAERQKIDLDSTTKLISVVMKDAQTKVTISKKAITGTDSIGGAELRVIDKDGKVVVEKWTTKAGEDTTVTGVFNVGETYTLQEVTPPAGYAKAADINFTLNKKGEIVINDKTETSVVMRDAKLQIKVSKKDITDTDELPGAVLQILDKADNSVIAEWTTTDKPVIITEKDCKKPLVAGNTYILHEKTAPDGYAYAKDVEFTVHVDSIEGNEQLVTMHDAKNVVVVSKTDLAGTKELPGAKLQILSSDGKTVLESWTSTNEEYKVTKKLKAGESYILREIEAPDGYAIADDVKFTVNKDGSTTKVVMKDAQTSVTVSKTDLTGEKEIAGAKLQILNKNGKVMEEWTSDGKTHAVTAALVADVTYILHEVSAPAGYRTAKDIEFTVDKTGKTTKVVMKDAPTKASILKTDESGKALSGAQLVVKDSTGKELDKWTSDGKAHEITGLLTVGETYTLSEVSAPSGYTVAPDQTFKMEDKDVIEVTMVDYQASGSGQITVTKKVTYANGGDFTDLIAQDDTFYVNLFTDAAGKYPYKGALPQAIHLVNASAGSVTFSDLAQGTYYVYETDANGNVINLNQQGMHNGSQFMCTVDGGSNTVKLDLKAGPKEGAVNLENVFFDIPTGYSYKGEININKQVLKGTTQTTTDDTFYAGIFTKGDDGVYNLFTLVQLVQNDTVTVEVPLGGKDGTEPINYYILETDADGNILDLDVFEYEVTGEGTVALSKDNLSGNINLVNKIPEDTDGKLRVQKTDGNGVGLAGASFRLTDEDGSVIDEWTSEASAHELELEPGTYTLTEVQAPTGYTGAGSVTIKVDDDYNFSVSGEIDYSYKGGLLKIVNKATPSTPSSGTPVSGGSTPASYSSALSGKVAVKTGDNTPIGAYAAVLVIAALAIAGGIFYKKKRKNDK